MKIAVMGSSDVGLASVECFADLGHEVTCVGFNERKNKALNNSEADFRVEDEARARRQQGGADVFHEPSRGCCGRSGGLHLGGYALAAQRRSCRVATTWTAEAVTGFAVAVTKSTVPVGTSDEVERIVRETNPRADVVVVSNSELLRKGVAIEGFKRPHLIVVGVEDERARGDFRSFPTALSQPGAALIHRPADSRAGRTCCRCVAYHENDLPQ
jgi:Predicted UDP-glucose 6-dehydrogenase